LNKFGQGKSLALDSYAMTLEDIAKEIGVSRRMVAKYLEQGLAKIRRNPKAVAHFIAIAELAAQERARRALCMNEEDEEDSDG
jgi:hypothetical protein